MNEEKPVVNKKIISKRSIAISEEDLAFINNTRGEKTAAKLLREIIAFYKEKKVIKK